MAAKTSTKMEDLPSRGGPEQLLIAVEKLKEGGSKPVGELEDEIDEYGGRNLSTNLKYGVLLGFIEREGNEAALTNSGFELAFAYEEEEDLSEFFKLGLREAEPYLALLRTLGKQSEEPIDSLIRNSELLQLLRTEFGLTETSETKLKGVVSGLFNTLEYAGFGERKDAGGGYPVRFSFGPDWNLASVLEDIQDESTEDVSSEQATNDEPSDEKSTEEQDLEGITSKSGEVFEREESEDKVEKLSDDKLPQPPESAQNVNITVNVDLDMNDMDTAEFKEKIKHLKDLF